MEQNHIIQKVVVEISVNSREKAFEIKDNISNFLTIEVFPNLENHFNAVLATLPSQILQISHLTVNTDEKHHSLDTVLKHSIAASFKKELTEILESKISTGSDTEKDLEINFLEKEEQLLRTFIHFLKTGYMPWWNSNEKPIAILEPQIFNKIVSAKAFASEIIYCMQNPKVQDRIINQLTDTQITQIYLKLIKTNAFITLEINALKKLLKQFPASRKAIWLVILDLVRISFLTPGKNTNEYITENAVKMFSLIEVDNPDKENEICESIMAIFPHVKQKDLINVIRKDKIKNISNKQAENVYPKETKKEKTAAKEIGNIKEKENEGKKNTILSLSKIKDKPIDISPLKTNVNIPEERTAEELNSYHVQNAGLIIIHPFMTNLFKRCNLVDPETKKLTKPEVCVHLLHYIATRKTNQPESDMLFEKFLCDIPLHQSINRHIRLSKKQKSEAEKVIEAVQQNWSAVKKSSVELLQNEFLQRSGKLVLKNNQVLTIERKTQDILLNKISWGLGLIKLPWQNQFIYVNW